MVGNDRLGCNELKWLLLRLFFVMMYTVDVFFLVAEGQCGIVS